MEIINSVVMGVSLTDWLGGFFADAKALINAALIIAGVVFAIVFIAKNPSMGRVLMGVVIGAFISGLPWIIPAVGEMFRGDITASGHYIVVENHIQALTAIDPSVKPEI